MKTLGVIIARGGSKRLPGKNVRLLGGQPLIAWSVRAALAARALGRCIVSTDDAGIAEVARAAGADVPFLRPAELAGDHVSPIAVMQHAVSVMDEAGYASDAVVLLQATSPFRSGKTIDQAVTVFREREADTLTAVSPAPAHPYWMWREAAGGRLEAFFSRDTMQIDRSQLPDAFVETGTIFIVKRSVLDSGTLYGDLIVPLRVSAVEALDIDTLDDFFYFFFIVASGQVALP